MIGGGADPVSGFRRAIVIVMDSVGIGELPDAAQYGDQGSNTLGNIARQAPLRVPTLRALGLGRVAALGAPPGEAADDRDRVRGVPPAAVGRMAEASAGKDSVTGHWEMMGIVLERPFPLFPHGFPDDVIERFSRPNKATLHYEATIDDPGAYTKPFKVAWDITWNGTSELTEYICQENNKYLNRLTDDFGQPLFRK